MEASLSLNVNASLNEWSPVGRLVTLTVSALVAQWIEHAPPKRGMQVRFLPGALPPDSRLGPVSRMSGERNRLWSLRRLPRCERLRGAAARATVRAVLVSESTLEAAPTRPSRRRLTHSPRPAPEPWRCACPSAPATRGGPSPRRSSLCSAVLVIWARTRPGFDPYGWLVWGHQTLIGSSTRTPRRPGSRSRTCSRRSYALAGHHAVRLWMITSAAIALSGMVFAGRIAYQLTDAAARAALGGVGGRRVRRPGAAGDPELLRTTSSARSRTR